MAKSKFLFWCVILFFAVVTTSCALKKLSGTKMVESNLNIDQTEIDVRAWLSYYTWKLEKEGLDSAKKVLPDSTAVDESVWKLIKTKTDKYTSRFSFFTFQPLGYFYDECQQSFDVCNKPITCLSTYLNYPITGITYEQAVEFCKWRTKVVNENELFVEYDKKHVTFRLPTEEEWKRFVKLGFTEHERQIGFRDSLAIMQDKKVKCNECPMYNYRHGASCDSLNRITVYVMGCFMPDKNQIYDTFGNVSEMTATKGVSKGGNYLLYAKQCHPDSIQHYSKPEKWLGFRCIAITDN